jgi:5-methylcytosine-specific restriction protein A
MRSVPEWIGRTPDSAIPPRVRVRVYERAGGCCGNCGRKIAAGDGWICDHIIALINHGQNREENLQVLCAWCNAEKTKADVAEKARTYARRAKHLGIRKSKSRPIPGTKASGVRKRMSGAVERW